MSGGHFNYLNNTLKSEIFGWTDEPHNVFEDMEISELTWDLLNLIHIYDYYVSGDTCRETYLKAKRAFKKKWFYNREVRAKRIIDIAVSEVRKELYETFDVDTNEEVVINA